jgi:hypothetical protein
VGLTALPLGVALLGTLPHTTTTDTGEYRFTNLPWWGRYTVYADDEEAGYSDYSTGTGGSHPPEVELSPLHREAELNVYVPPKAGFLNIDLSNRKTGTAISGMRIAVMQQTDPAKPLFTMSCFSTNTILIPPDKDLLLHVTSDGFREWDESVGHGRPLHLASGARLKLNVQLEPQTSLPLRRVVIVDSVWSAARLHAKSPGR